MNACTGISAIQLLAMALTFLLAVLSLDVFWVRVRNELHQMNPQLPIAEVATMDQRLATALSETM